MKKKNTEQDYIKANRRGSREAEIELRGRPMTRCMVHKSKKIYSRKNRKAGLGNLPDFLYGYTMIYNFTGSQIGKICASQDAYVMS